MDNLRALDEMKVECVSAETISARLDVYREANRLPSTDFSFVWQYEDRIDAVLVDSNNLAPEHAAALLTAIESALLPMSEAQAPCEDMLGAGRTVATKWLTAQDIPPRERFVNAALLRIVGSVVEYGGAFAPAYIWEGGPAQRWTPRGTVWGMPHLGSLPAGVPGRIALRHPSAIVIASDGMLESRNGLGKINGDGPLLRFIQEEQDAHRRFRDLLSVYGAAAIDRDDSFQLVVVSSKSATDAEPGDGSLILFKADSYESGAAEEIGAMLRAAGLAVVDRFSVEFGVEAVFALWPAIYGKTWTTSLIDSMTGRTLDVWELRGANAVREVIAIKDALRSRRTDANSYKNLLHSPDSDESFLREIEFLRSHRAGGRLA